MTHGAAQDSAQHIAATFVRRIDTVGKEERHRTGMVGENAIGCAGGAAIIGPADDLHRVRDDRLE